MPKKILVACFSATDTTRRLAQTIAQVTGGDQYDIEPKKPYTLDDLNWRNPASRSSVEMRDKSSRPEVQGNPGVTAPYDVIFLGFPIWWYVAPTVVNSFLEGENLTGKIIVPFATSGGSGMGGTEAALSPSAPGAVFKPGKVLPASASQADVRRWVDSLGLDK